MREPAQLLACPRCAGSLTRDDKGLVCGACAVSYPSIGDVPCLVPEPGLWRARWTQRLDHYLTVAERRVAEINVERTADGLLRSTRERLIRIMGALAADREVIARVLAPLRDGAAGPAPVVPIPAAILPTEDHALLKCSENLFRDWVWGDAESASALALVQRLLAGLGITDPIGRLALFGAGAGRLAVDLHRTLHPASLVALDVNPLPLLIASRLIHGDTVDLHEFPVGPHGQASVALRRTLRCASPVGADTLAFVIGDGLRPPLAPASVDIVLTPWFIDAVGVDPRVTIAAINRVLRPGGLWLNFGPLRFSGAAAGQYTIEEIREIATAGGFQLGCELREQVPYFASPDSGSHRVETIFAHAARKVGEGTAPELPSLDPPWVIDPRLPIPRLADWETLRRSAVFTTGIISMIDGRRSIAEVADALARSWGIDPRVIEDPLRAFLLRLVHA